MAAKARKRGSTSRDDVVQAALAVVDDVGVEALTIRRVAARVGIPAMSLYSHFATKEELVELMTSEATRQLYADNGQATWQGECAALCQRARRLLLEHPRWIALLARPSDVQLFPTQSRVLQLMTADGIPVADALQALYNVVLLALGFSLTELTLHEQARPGERSSDPPAVDPGTFSASESRTERAIAGASPITMERSFQAAVRVFIAGIAAQPRRR